MGLSLRRGAASAYGAVKDGVGAAARSEARGSTDAAAAPGRSEHRRQRPLRGDRTAVRPSATAISPAALARIHRGRHMLGTLSAGADRLLHGLHGQRLLNG